MTGKTHRILGLVAGGSYLIFSSEPSYQPATFGAVLVFSYFASLIPDLDQPTAEIWNNLPFGHLAGEAVDPFFKHRNLSHSLLGFGIFGFLFYLLINSFPSYWGINRDIVLFAFLISYLSHLLADIFTVEGIPLLYPWKKMLGIPPKPFDGIRIETGKWFENLVIFPLLNIFLLIIVIVNWEKIKNFLLK